MSPGLMVSFCDAVSRNLKYGMKVTYLGAAVDDRLARPRKEVQMLVNGVRLLRGDERIH